jgi:hypothetical protein
MRTSKFAGRIRFSADDHLTSSQVKSYFSKLTSTRRQQTQHLNNASSDRVTDLHKINDTDTHNDESEEEEEDSNGDYDSLNEETQRQQLRFEVNQMLGSNSLWDDTDGDA